MQWFCSNSCFSKLLCPEGLIKSIGNNNGRTTTIRRHVRTSMTSMMYHCCTSRENFPMRNSANPVDLRIIRNAFPYRSPVRLDDSTTSGKLYGIIKYSDNSFERIFKIVYTASDGEVNR